MGCRCQSGHSSIFYSCFQCARCSTKFEEFFCNHSRSSSFPKFAAFWVCWYFWVAPQLSFFCHQRKSWTEGGCQHSASRTGSSCSCCSYFAGFLRPANLRRLSSMELADFRDNSFKLNSSDVASVEVQLNLAWWQNEGLDWVTASNYAW